MLFHIINIKREYMNRTVKILKNTVANGRVVFRDEILNISEKEFNVLISLEKAVEVSEETKTQIIKSQKADLIDVKQEEKKLTKRGK
jgi:hypothetical protein